MGRMFSGLVLGGPLDGKRVDHVSPHYRVPLWDPTTCDTPSGWDLQVDTINETIEIVEYQHIELFESGKFWIPIEVIGGGRHGHKFYRDQYEFVMETLMKSYRPEGF